MEITLCDKSVEMIKSSLPEIGIKVPLKDDDVLKVIEYFRTIEIDLANKESYGKKIDYQYMDDVCNIISDLSKIEENDFVGLDKLNDLLTK